MISIRLLKIQCMICMFNHKVRMFLKEQYLHNILQGMLLNIFILKHKLLLYKLNN